MTGGEGQAPAVEAEEAVLGGLLLDPVDAWEQIGEVLEVNHFTGLRALVAEAIIVRSRAGMTVDAVLVANDLRARGNGEAGALALRVLSRVGTAGNLSHYVGALEVARERRAAEPEPGLAGRWRSFTETELLADPPRKEWIWQYRIPRGDVGVVAAPGASGKTSLLVGLAIHRAMGRPFLGLWVRQGSTVIVTTEDDAGDYRRKIAAWREWMRDLDVAAVARHVHLLDLAGVPFRLVRSEFGDYVPTDAVEQLADVIRRRAPDADLVVAETVSRLGGDEGNAAMSALVCAGEQLRTITGASVALVSHVSKAAAREKNGDSYSPRGGSAITDNGRFTITLAGLDSEQANELLPGVPLSQERLRELAVLRAPKVNAAPPQDPVVLQRIGTPWGLILRPFDVPATETTEEAGATARATRGAALAASAARLCRLGVSLTVSRLSSDSGLRRTCRLSKDGVQAAVQDAVEDGFLEVVDRKGRGGGKALVPGPSHKPPVGEGCPEGSPDTCSEAGRPSAGYNSPAPKEGKPGELFSPGRSHLPRHAPGEVHPATSAGEIQTPEGAVLRDA